MKISRKSLRRFIKLWIQIEKPDAYFHQTLTFPIPQHNFVAAKERLNKLLDNIHHQFSAAASVFIGGRHKTGAFHFHVVFFFFLPVSGAAQKRFKQALWKAWQALQPRRCSRKANEFHRRDAEFADRLNGIRYFAGEIRVLEPRWWGSWNRALIKKHSRAVTRAEINKGVDCLGLGRKTRKNAASVAPRPIPQITMKDVKKLRKWVEADPTRDWESIKRWETGRQGRVSDKDYLDCRNGVDPRDFEFP